MSQWPFGIDSSKAAELARKSAQEDQRIKDQAERRKKILGVSSGVKERTKDITEKK